MLLTSGFDTSHVKLNLSNDLNKYSQLNWRRHEHHRRGPSSSQLAIGATTQTASAMT